MTLLARTRLVFVVLVVACSVAVGTEPGTVSACSCAVGDPVVAIDAADVVFIGTLVDKAPVGPDDGYHYDWTFAVDGVVKGDVSSPQFVAGEEFGSGCGVNYDGLPGPISVYARRDGDRLVSISCSPTLSAAALRDALNDAAGESGIVGSGPPSALATGASADGNVFVLGSDGLPLARGRLSVESTAIAHCAGTARAAVWSYGPPVDRPNEPAVAGTANVVSIVDLETMEVVSARGIESEFVSVRDQLVCVDGGRLVMLSRGDGTDEGRVTVATSTAADGVSRVFDGVSRAVIHPSGTVALLPRGPGEPIRTVAGPSLETVGPASGTETGADLAFVGGAFSPDGGRFAALVTSTGVEVQYDTDATGVLLFDVIGGVVQPPQRDPVPVPPHDGRTRGIGWLDDDTLVLEQETDESKLLTIVTTEGTVVASGDVGWGWGLTPVDGSIVRSRDGGLELVDTTMASTPLVPAPSEQFEDGWFSTAAIVDPPEMTLPSFEPSGPTIRPFEQPNEPAPNEPAGDPGEVGSPLAPTDQVVDSGRSPAVVEAQEDRGLQVAGFAFVAYLVVGAVLIVRRRRRPLHPSGSARPGRHR
jgi:hypothetical protein